MSTFEQQLLLTVVDKLIIAFLIAIAIYYFNRLLEKFKSDQSLRREYEVLRDRVALTHLQRQIEELYSPLLGLIQQKRIIYEIAHQKCPQGRHSANHEVWSYFTEKDFLNLDSQIASLIRTKVYLLETDELPKSFELFLTHATQFHALYMLWKDKKTSSVDIPITPWPTAFESDVKTSLDKLRRSYNENLSRLNVGI